MKKRPIIICLLVAILGSVIFWLQSNYIITGWLKGEAFYQGRPTSYWRRELADLDAVFVHTGIRGQQSHPLFFRSTSPGPKWFAPFIKDNSFVTVSFLAEHPLWNAEPEAKGVLTELMVGSSESVRAFAKRGLARIEQGK